MRLKGGDVLWSRVGDQVLVLDQRRQLYLGINPTGAALWDLLEAGCQPDQLTHRLAEVFGLEEAQAGRDAARFVASLEAQGLLEDAGASGTGSRSS